MFLQHCVLDLASVVVFRFTCGSYGGGAKEEKYNSGHQNRTSKANSIANTLKLDTYYIAKNVDENIRNDNDVDLNVPSSSSINDESDGEYNSSSRSAVVKGVEHITTIVLVNI